MVEFDDHIFQMGWFNHQLALFRVTTHIGFRKYFGFIIDDSIGLAYAFSWREKTKTWKAKRKFLKKHLL